MARRREDDEPGLIDRFRWRNLGRLVLLVALPALALAPRGCGRREAVLPPEVRVRPPAPPPAPVETADGGRRPAEPERKKARKPRHHKRRRHHRRIGPKPPRAAIPRPAAPAPA